jgi:hypothetical protein
METTALSRWDALQSQIAIAEQEAKGQEFDYDSKSGNREARSYVAKLRKLRADVERCRKEAKAIHVERGRAVDVAAAGLESSVLALIAPHEQELQAIERREQQRQDAHRAVIAEIRALSLGVETSGVAEWRLIRLTEIDTSGLEEFRLEAEAELIVQRDLLLHIRGELAHREAEKAELEKLRAEHQARQKQKEEERIAREAVEAERRRTEREQREAAEAAAKREADALQAAEDARRAQEEAERRAEEAEARERDRLAAEERAAEERKRQEANEEGVRNSCKALLQKQLVAAMEGLSREGVATAIVAGKLHPALACHWNRV